MLLFVLFNERSKTVVIIRAKPAKSNTVNLFLSHKAEKTVALTGSIHASMLPFEAPIMLTPLRYKVNGMAVPIITITATKKTVVKSI